MKEKTLGIDTLQLENDLLKRQLTQAEAEMAIINSVGEAMSKQLDIKTVTKIVGDKVKDIFNTQVTEILLVDDETGLITVPYSYYKGYQTVEPFKLGKGLTSKVINSRKPLLIGTFEEAGRLGVLVDSDEEKTESYLGVPIIFGEKVLGVVSIQSYEQNAYDENHVRLFSTLSTNMGVALQNAKLFETSEQLLNETKQRNAELGVINSVQEGLAKELEINGIYELVGEKIREIFNAQVIDIVTYDKKDNTVQDCYAYEKGDRTLVGKRPLQGFRKHVIESQKPLVINENRDEISKKYGGNPVVIGEKPKSLVFVPMITGDEVTGVISLQNLDKENAFDKSDVRLLSTLANSMKVALENARLFDETNRLLNETKQRNAELGVINSVQEGLVKQVDLQAIYDLVGEQIQEIFDTQVVGIATFNRESKTETFNFVLEKGERFYPEPRKYDKVREYLIKNKKLILINENYVEAAKKYGMKVVEGTEMPKSLLFVPLIVGKKVNGYITLQNIDRENAFSDSDVRLLTTLTNSMSVALENARLFDETNKLLEETKQQAIELGIINSVGEGLAKQLDFQSIIDLVGEKIREVFNAQVVSISTYDSEREEVHHRYAVELDKRYYFDKPQPIDADRKEIIETKHPLIFGTAQEAIDHSGEEVVAGEMPESFMGVPIIRNQEATGVITVQDIERQNLYSENDVRLLMTLASNMGVALENARLFEETKRLLNETQQRNAELGVINSVQEGLVKQVELQEIYNLIGDKIKEIFDTQAVIIASFDKDKKEETFNYLFENGERFYPEPREYDKVREYIIENKKLILINENYIEAAKKYGMKVIPGTEMPKSLLFVPLIVADNVFGYISLQNIEKENAFSESSVRLISTITNSMSVAIENARLFNQTKSLLKEMQQRNAELGVINSVQEGLAKELDMQGIYTLVGERLCSLFPDSQTLVIRTFDHVSGVEHWQFAIEKGVLLDVAPRPLNWNSKQLIKSKEPILINKDYVETAKKYGGTGVIKGQPPKSAVFVPMMIGETVGGSISLQNVDRENAFTDSDLRLLTTITNSMIVALENARLFEETNRLLKETEQRNVELSILNAIQEGLVQEMEFESIINLVGDKLREALGFQDLGIRLYDKEKNILHFPYEYEHGERLYLESGEPTTFSQYVLNKGEMLLMRKNTDEEAAKLGITGQLTIPGTDRSKCLVMVPIMLGKEAKGLILIENYDEEDAFTESDVNLLNTIAKSMSVALENARLFNETLRLLDESKKRAAELSTVNSISQAIVGHLEIEKLIKLVGDKVRDLFKANIVYVALLNKDTEIMDFPYGYGDEYPPLKLGEGLTSKIILNKEPLLMNRKTDEREEKIIGTPSASYLGVPIPVGDEIIGVLSVQSTENENVFNEDDMRLLNTIAAHVGIAINNANSYEELNKTLENLQATQNKLVAQEKLASLGQLTAGIAHEIKNPLNFVNNFSELSVSLVEELEEEIGKLDTNIDKNSRVELKEILDSLKQNSEKIKEHGKRADSIVHSMLQHSRGKAGDKQPTDINVMLDEDLNLVYHGMRAQDSTFNIKIERNYDKNLPEVNVVPQDMSRVFLNIMSNGCYEAHRKKIEKKSADPAIIKVSTCNTDKYVEVRIRDNGCGVPEHIRENLFTPFFTTKPTGKGTGLGLSISYDIVVSEHNGELLFETESDKFTEFIIRLPKNKQQKVHYDKQQT